LGGNSQLTDLEKGAKSNKPYCISHINRGFNIFCRITHNVNSFRGRGFLTFSSLFVMVKQLNPFLKVLIKR